MARLVRWTLPLCVFLVACGLALAPGGYLVQAFAQAAGFLETFDGTPPRPVDYANRMLTLVQV